MPEFGEEIEEATPSNIQQIYYILAFLICLWMLFTTLLAGTTFDPVQMGKQMIDMAWSMIRKQVVKGKMMEMTGIGLCLDRKFWESLRKRKGEMPVEVLFALLLVIMAIAVGLFIFSDVGRKVRDALGILG